MAAGFALWVGAFTKVNDAMDAFRVEDTFEELLICNECHAHVGTYSYCNGVWMKLCHVIYPAKGSPQQVPLAMPAQRAVGWKCRKLSKCEFEFTLGNQHCGPLFLLVVILQVAL